VEIVVERDCTYGNSGGRFKLIYSVDGKQRELIDVARHILLREGWQWQLCGGQLFKTLRNARRYLERLEAGHGWTQAEE
jgi:hypothetical protein